jgi:hypothetical protein
MDHTGDFGREAGADVSGSRPTEVHSHLSAGATDAGTTAASAGAEAKGAAAKAAGRVREGAEDAVERVREAGQHAYDRVQQAKEKLDDGWSEAKTRARDTVENAEDLLERRTGLLPWVRSNPMPAALIAFGAGMVLSGGALGGKRSGIRGQLRSALLSSLGGMLMTQARGFLDETLRT